MHFEAGIGARELRLEQPDLVRSFRVLHLDFCLNGHDLLHFNWNWNFNVLDSRSGNDPANLGQVLDFGNLHRRLRLDDALVQHLPLGGALEDALLRERDHAIVVLVQPLQRRLLKLAIQAGTHELGRAEDNLAHLVRSCRALSVTILWEIADVSGLSLPTEHADTKNSSHQYLRWVDGLEVRSNTRLSPAKIHRLLRRVRLYHSWRRHLQHPWSCQSIPRAMKEAMLRWSTRSPCKITQWSSFNMSAEAFAVT